MLDILFSHSYFYRYDSKQWNNKTPYPPLGTIYAAGYLRRNGYTVDLFDSNLLKTHEGVELHFKSKTPKYFVIYDDGFNYLTKMCLTNMREAAFKMIILAKRYHAKVIVCSSDSTDHQKAYLDEGADFVIMGEGELTLLELIKKLDANQPTSDVLGIAYKKESDLIQNPKRPVLNDLDEIGQPAWDLVDVESYREIWKEGSRPFSLNIATTRGCPYKCNWCAKPIYGNRYNTHSPKFIVEQAAMLQKEYGVSDFWMCDDIFGLKPKWVQEFNDELKRNDLSISYLIQSRVDLLLKDDNIDVLVESGLKEVWVGAESGSQRILDKMDKGTKVEQIYTATQLLKAKGVRVCFFLQFGYLSESWEDIKKTIRMTLDLMPDNIGISVSYPLPGTKFFEIVKDQLDEKSNWTDSDDLDLMFKNTYKAAFYKTLHRYVHNQYRIKRGWLSLNMLSKNKMRSFKGRVTDIMRMIYNVPLSIIHRIVLQYHINK